MRRIRGMRRSGERRRTEIPTWMVSTAGMESSARLKRPASMGISAPIFSLPILVFLLGLVIGAPLWAEPVSQNGSGQQDSTVGESALGANPGSSSPKRALKFSALTDSTAEGAWVPGYGEKERGTYGFEQFGNIRLEAPLRDRGTVFLALNVQAASGTRVSSLQQGSPALTMGKGYASAVELERLYYRLESESADWEAGLLRIPFGFGQAWRPTDFLNPPNPLTPDARPRGVLGTVYTFYPSDLSLFRFFASAGEDPTRVNGAGGVGGILAELHEPAFSVQGWYSLQAPSRGKERPDHRFGFSCKWDGEVAFVLDALYTLEGDAIATGNWYDRNWNPLRGLQATAGIDGSWGDFVALLQYLYNGPGVLDSGDSLANLYDTSGGDWRSLPPASRAVRVDVPVKELNRKNYLYGSLLYRLNDYTNLTLNGTVNLDDGSWVPAVSISHEPFQGFTLQATLRVFLDPDLWGTGPAGELGPLHTGRRGDFVVKVQVRF